MPAGVVFSRYTPYFFDSLEIKGETWGNDFLTIQVVSAFKINDINKYADILDFAQETGKSIELDFNDNYFRDGLFEQNQMFAVWENSDIDNLIDCLQRAKLSMRHFTDKIY
jgi:hypothetical protein